MANQSEKKAQQAYEWYKKTYLSVVIGINVCSFVSPFGICFILYVFCFIYFFPISSSLPPLPITLIYTHPQYTDLFYLLSHHFGLGIIQFPQHGWFYHLFFDQFFWS